MFDKKIKNLSIMPTSELVFYSIYNDKTDFSVDQLQSVLKKRLSRKYLLGTKSAQNIIDRDADIITARGSNLNNYIFDFSRGLSSTTTSFYEKLAQSPYFAFKDSFMEKLMKEIPSFSFPTADNFTFSELCLGFHFFNDLETAYKKRDISLNQINKPENGEMIEFFKTMNDIFLSSFKDIFVSEDWDENKFRFLKQNLLLLLALMNEFKFYVSNNQMLQEELAAYNDLSCDVAFLDKQLIFKNKETTKIYKHVANITH